jgi:undecaprenyl-diphosphatase
MEIFAGDVRGSSSGTGVILIGFVAAFISGYLACRWMITLVKKSKLIWFSIYCAVVGIISILLG